MSFRTMGDGPRAIPLNAVKIVKSIPGEPHYPVEPGTMFIDQRNGMIYVRSDEYETVLANLRRVSANDEFYFGGDDAA